MRMCANSDALTAGLVYGSRVEHDAKLMSCDSEPFGLMVSFGSWPAEAVIGRLPLKMSQTLIVYVI